MRKVDETTLLSLLDDAFTALEKAYVPYSHFRVGACLLTDEGVRYLGCNIENAAFTPTNCAERTAMFKAVYEGERSFCALAVASEGDKPAFPCGVCRQVLAEFCEGELPIVCAGGDRKPVFTTLSGLLPHSFGPKDLL